MEKKIRQYSENQIMVATREYTDKAKAILNDPEKMRELLQNLEELLEFIPKVGESLSKLPVMISMANDYIRKLYKEVPGCIIVAIICCFIYVVTPIDLLPDTLGALGYTDDAGAVAATNKIANPDILKYKRWQVENGMRNGNTVVKTAITEVKDVIKISKKAA